jgi:hypothetical protein
MRTKKKTTDKGTTTSCQLVPTRTIHDLPAEQRALIRGYCCRLRTDPKTGIIRRTISIYIYGRRNPMMKYTTYITNSGQGDAR